MKDISLVSSVGLIVILPTIVLSSPSRQNVEQKSLYLSSSKLQDSKLVPFASDGFLSNDALQHYFKGDDIDDLQRTKRYIDDGDAYYERIYRRQRQGNISQRRRTDNRRRGRISHVRTLPPSRKFLITRARKQISLGDSSSNDGEESHSKKDPISNAAAFENQSKPKKTFVSARASGVAKTVSTGSSI